MEIKSVYISQSVADKILREHNVEPTEVREVFSNAYFKPKIYRSERIPGAYVAYGRTLEGRYLMVAFFRYNKQARVITLCALDSTMLPLETALTSTTHKHARDLTSTERKRFERK